MLKKLLRDLWVTRGRASVMVLSMAVGLLAFSTLTGAHSILTRELSRNYLESRPASITFKMQGVSEQALAYVRSQRDVLAATRRARLQGRFSTETNRDKRRAVVFVVDDFRDTDIATIFPQSGAFPPDPGTVVIERSAQEVVGGGIGTTLQLLLPGVRVQNFQISGIVHEPALAPANTEQAVYAYLTRDELSSRGLDVPFDELRVIPHGPITNTKWLEQYARELTRRIEASGFGKVTALSIPPPATHPHQTQMTTVLALFMIFALLIVVLSSLLTASLISTMMSRQVREMGIMKTLGARTSQVLLSYVLLVEFIALLAWLMSLYPSGLGTQAFVKSITRVLNFDVVDHSVGAEVRVVQVCVAFLVPLIVVLPALVRASRVSVTQSMADFGVGRALFGNSAVERWISSLDSWGEFSSYALRNALRRRSRFLLSLALLASAGAIFLAAMNTARSWEVLTERLYVSRHYDFEVGFTGSVEAEALAGELAELKEITAVEVWESTRTALGSGEVVPIEMTYPDGAHGAFSLVAPPLGHGVLRCEGGMFSSGG